MKKVQSKFIQHGELWIHEQYKLVEGKNGFTIKRKELHAGGKP